MDIRSHKELQSVVKLVLTLSHGQVAVEQGFSINKSILEHNMKKDSIVARKLIKDNLITHSLTPESFVITKDLISSCLSAHRKYKEHLKSLKEEKEEKSKELKVLLDEIIEVEHSQEKLLKASENMDTEFVDSIKRAESEKDAIKVF